MQELTINLHMHTIYSDGTGTHEDIGAAAAKAGLDAVIVTDHNVWVKGVEGYYGPANKKTLLMVGEEVHDQGRLPQVNHMLVFGAEREVAPLAPNPQELIDGIHEAGGISFLAHPIDYAAPTFGEGSLAWVDWDVNNFTGIELWNAMTEFKSHLSGWLKAFYYAYNFKQIGMGPFPEALKLWDELLAKGRPVVAVGGSDAHRMIKHVGPLTRILFPYEQHFGAVNTHILTTDKLNGNLERDKAIIIKSLRAGHCFIGYDLPAPTKGFRFTAHCATGESMMGDTVSAKESITLQIKLPEAAELHLLKDGVSIRSSSKRTNLVHKVEEPGVYRVEAYRKYKGRRRGWIFSNPIYVRA